MTTFPDDFIRINLMTAGAKNFPCKLLGLEWPPPERIVELNGQDFSDDPLIRISMSEITDEQRERMTHVARGAEYVYEKDVK